MLKDMLERMADITCWTLAEHFHLKNLIGSRLVSLHIHSFPNRVRMSHLIRLLRPEFVVKYHKPLCSDGFSRFIKGNDDHIHNAELQEATKYLRAVVVPDFATQWIKLIREAGKDVSEVSVVTSMHRCGINMRYLGLVFQKLTEMESSSKYPDTISSKNIQSPKWLSPLK